MIPFGRLGVCEALSLLGRCLGMTGSRLHLPGYARGKGLRLITAEEDCGYEPMGPFLFSVFRLSMGDRDG